MAPHRFLADQEERKKQSDQIQEQFPLIKTIRGIPDDERTNKRGIVDIRYRIQDKCNLDCSYCSEHGKMKEPSTENLKTMLNNIDRMFHEDSRKINFFIWGGEPFINTTSLELFKFITTMRTEVNQVSFLTNLTHDMDGVIRSLLGMNYNFRNNKSLFKLEISGSIHLETYDKYSETIMRNLLTMNTYVQAGALEMDEISIMVQTKQDIKKAEIIKKHLIKYSIPGHIINLAPIRESEAEEYMMTSCEYPYELDAGVLLGIPNDMFLSEYKIRYPHFTSESKHWKTIDTSEFKCNAGLDSFQIGTDGKVYRCHSDYLNNQPMVYEKMGHEINMYQDWTWSNLEGYLWDNFDARKCGHSKCICEWGLEKTKIEG